MFESDSDRLALIRALGGMPCQAPRGDLQGIFDADYVGVGDVPVDSSGPRLTVRSSDATRLGIGVGVSVLVAGTPYVVRSVQPDGLGMTGLILDET